MTPRTLALLALLTLAPVHAETLGRLFHTPEQRALLDQTRRNTPAGVLSPDNSAADMPGVTVNGIVTRSDGKRSTWVNGRMENGTIGGNGNGSVRMTLPSGDVQLRVGQHIDPASGQVTESYRRVPPPAAPPKPEAAPAATPTPKKKLPEARDDDAPADETR
jgi:hypothetical protein